MIAYHVYKILQKIRCKVLQRFFISFMFFFFGNNLYYCCLGKWFAFFNFNHEAFMLKRVNFTKKQRLVLQRVFVDANHSFNECMRRKPNIYREEERAFFVIGYVEQFLKSLASDGFVYLEV